MRVFIVALCTDGNMQIVQLDAAEVAENDDEIIIKDHKAFLLTQWLERGVFKILEDGHLGSMAFAVYTQHPITKDDLLLEVYEFKFSYANGIQLINGVPLTTKEDIKLQAGKFIRNLVFFSQSLEELPQNHWITIEIKVR